MEYVRVGESQSWTVSINTSGPPRLIFGNFGLAKLNYVISDIHVPNKQLTCLTAGFHLDGQVSPLS